ncbi:MAG: ABC transporter permease [Thermosediminibacteraceae bacterium]|nr:ABC transporter permease [Thermosediminibacteraceae bacterium]
MKALRAATAEMIREIQESWYYKANFVSDLIREIIIFGMIIFLGGYSSMGAVYNVPRTETRPLVLLGYLFWSYSAFALSAMGYDISFEAARGILEYKFTSVAPPALLLAGKAIGGIVTSTGFILVMCALIFLLFRVSIDVTAGALAALLLTLVGMYGLGYVFAGFALYAKRVNRAVTVFGSPCSRPSGVLVFCKARPEKRPARQPLIFQKDVL